MNQAFLSPICEGPPHFLTLHAQPESAVPNLQAESDPCSSELLRRTVAEEVEHDCANRFFEAAKQTVENDVSIYFITGASKKGGKIKKPLLDSSEAY